MGLAAFNRSRRAAAEAARQSEEAEREAAAEAARQQAEAETALEELRSRAKELGVENAERKGEKRLLEEIAAAEAALLEKEAQEELQLLIEQAAGLGINADGKDAAALRAEIAEKVGDPNGGGPGDDQ